MKKYCLDTSGLKSTPLENMPEDDHSSPWSAVAALRGEGMFAVTVEDDEFTHLPGPIGECIKANGSALQMELEEETWDWQAYIAHFDEMKIKFAAVISEYHGNRKGHRAERPDDNRSS